MAKYIVEVPDDCIPKSVHCDSNSGFTVTVSVSNSAIHIPDESQAIKEMKALAEPVKQQPAVPIQFVYDERVCVLRSVKDAALFDYVNCTVEQIGAVLYVRGE